jgi:hypothetical protein
MCVGCVCVYIFETLFKIKLKSAWYNAHLITFSANFHALCSVLMKPLEGSSEKVNKIIILIKKETAVFTF